MDVFSFQSVCLTKTADHNINAGKIHQTLKLFYLNSLTTSLSYRLIVLIYNIIPYDY